MSHDKRPDLRPEQRLAPLSEQAILPRPETLPVPTTTTDEKSYFFRRREYATQQWREHQKVELIATFFGAIVAALGIGTIVGGIAAGIAAAVIAFILALDAIYIIHFLRAPSNLDKKKQAEIDELNAKINELNASKAELESSLDTEVNNHTRDVQSLNDKNLDLWERLRSIQDEKAAIEGERDALKSQLESLVKLVFEVDKIWSGRVYGIEATNKPFEFDSYSLTASLKILLANNDTQNQRYFWNMKLSLMRNTRNGQGKEKRVTLENLSLIQATNEEGAPIHYRNGLPIEPGGRAFHWFVYNFTLATKYLRRLNQHCFLRLTMEAAGQPPYSADIYVDWDNVRQPSGAYITTRTVVQYGFSQN